MSWPNDQDHGRRAGEFVEAKKLGPGVRCIALLGRARMIGWGYIHLRGMDLIVRIVYIPLIHEWLIFRIQQNQVVYTIVLHGCNEVSVI